VVPIVHHIVVPIVHHIVVPILIHYFLVAEKKEPYAENNQEKEKQERMERKERNKRNKNKNVCFYLFVYMVFTGRNKILEKCLYNV
jgi:Na+/H+ antiporter NhaD/arsenite permease-like protein